MNAFSSEVIDRLGWVLIHSLWQFAIAAIVAALIVAALRRRSATSRYTVLVVAMLMMVVAPCATWIMFPASGWASALRVDAVNTDLDATVLVDTSTNNSAISTPLEAHAEVGATMPELHPAVEFGAVDQTRSADAQPLAEVTWIEFVRPWFSWIVGSWLIGVLLCALRPLLGWRMLRRLRRIGISPPSDEVLAVFARVSQHLGLRRSVQIFHSTLAAGPLVVGYLKPIVLLPVSLVCSIPQSQLEAILAHELAHIRRHDFIINLAQTLMETLFFYHPSIWWLSRRIRIEREHCCDDLVVKLFNNGIDYGRALVAIEQLKSQRTVLALGARDGSLLGRIRRITGATSHQPRCSPFLTTMIAMTLMCGVWIAGNEPEVQAVTETDQSPVNADSNSQFTPTSIHADLPTGVRVQLAGVTIPIVLSEDLLKQGASGALAPLPTAENSDTREWWSGDGLKLDTAPEPGQSWMALKAWKDARTFAFEVSGLPDTDSELNVVMFHDRAAERQQAVMVEVSKSQLDPGKRIILGSIAPDADAVSATLELRIGTGKSATVKFNTDGKRIDSLDDEAALYTNSMKQIIEEIKFLRIVQKENDVDVWTRPITTNGQLGSVRYSVVDKTGTSHSSSGGYSINDEQLTPFQNLTVADIREVHFEIRAFDHSVMFENVSRKPGTKSEVKVTVAPLPKPREPIQVRLPNNEMIELLGVSTPPIEPPFKDKREWWKGDGTPMEMAPIPMGSIYVGASESDGREFVVRASNFAGQFPMDATLKERFKEGQPYKPKGNGWSQSSTQSGPIDADQKDKWQVTSEYVAGPVGDADSATLEVRVGSSVAAEMLFDVKGQRLNGDSKDDVWQLAAVRKMAEPVEVLQTGPHEAGFAIWTKPFSSTTDEGTLHVALIDTSGQRHNPFTSGSDGTEAYYAFETKPEEIDKFVVRLRPYQYMATFENVSLKPGAKSDVKVAVTSLTAEKPPVAAASESEQKPADAAESAFAAYLARFAGTVKDDAGQPLEGAKIYITRAKSPDVFSNGMGQQSASDRGNTVQTNPTPVRATTDANGHFQFDAPEMIGEKPDGTPALYDGWVVAKKDGYGTDFFQTLGTTYNGTLWSTIGVDRAMIEMQLTKDDVPVRGRLLDPDGKPLVGAMVTMKSIGIPRKLSLDAHLEREIAANERSGFLSGRSIYQRSMLQPDLVPGLTTSIQTNTDGWFEFNGIGRERLVTLSVLHPQIQDAHLEVMTRVASDVGTIQDQNGKPTQTIHGSGFTKQMPVGLTVRGIVRDRNTKAPLAGIWVTTKGHPIAYAAYNPSPAMTDKEGRFTITGLNPVYATLAKEKREIAAYPQPGMPYVMTASHFEIDGDTIIECGQGIPYRLKIVDESGNPVFGDVHYVPISPNPAVFDLMRASGLQSGTTDAAHRDDGSFEGIVLPGPGAVLFKARIGKSLRPAFVDPKTFFAPQQKLWPEHSNHVFGTHDDLSTVFGTRAIQGNYEAIVLINPPSDSAPLELSATVFKDRPRKVDVVDSDGKPVIGVEAAGLLPDRTNWSTLSSSTFILRRMFRDRLKQVTFNHKDRNLTAVLLARGDTDEPIKVVMQPPATVTGRLVLQDGKPMKNPHLAMRATDEGADVLRLGKPEPDGRFRIEGLIPGLSFASVNSGDVIRFVKLDGQAIENIVLQPGEVRDVGDVKVVSDER